MFTINSYLQFRNTPDGKPRVLINEINYNLNYLKTLYLTDNKIFSGYYCEEQVYVKIKGGMVEVANLQDCRPLLTCNYEYSKYTRIDGVDTDLIIEHIWTVGDVVESIYTRGALNNTKDCGILQCTFLGGASVSICNIENDEREETRFIHDGFRQTRKDIRSFKKLSSFFDDPAKYSKLLWNCPEEEGWQKVFKLLNINL